MSEEPRFAGPGHVCGTRLRGPAHRLNNPLGAQSSEISTGVPTLTAHRERDMLNSRL
jgi:hypothetical protein